MKTTFKQYKVTFYKWVERKDQEPELKSLGSQKFFHFSDDHISPIGRAFCHAQGEQKDAKTFEIVELD